MSSIASARRFQLVVEGEARHAGGTPYDMRRDALLGASEAALAVERICRAEHHIIGTVGQLEAFPGAVNIVPGEAHFSLDLRGEFDGERDRVWDAISRELDGIMGRRGLRWRAREIHSAPAVFCAPLLQDVVREGILSTLRRAAPTTRRPSSAAPATTAWRSARSPTSGCCSCATPTASATTPTRPCRPATSRSASGPSPNRCCTSPPSPLT